MRRFLAPVLALLAVCCLSTAALADDPPAPSWNLNIPADTAVPYGATDTSIGWVTVSDVENADSYVITCKISHTDFASGADTIPLEVVIDWHIGGVFDPMYAHLSTGSDFALYDVTVPDRASKAEVFALVDAADWAAAAPGVYTATVTYTSELLAKD